MKRARQVRELEGRGVNRKNSRAGGKTDDEEEEEVGVRWLALARKATGAKKTKDIPMRAWGWGCWTIGERG